MAWSVRCTSTTGSSKRSSCWQLSKVLEQRVPNLTGEHVRWWFVFKWVVIYDPESSPISILRVIHGARDLERLLRPNQ